MITLIGTIKYDVKTDSTFIYIHDYSVPKRIVFVIIVFSISDTLVSSTFLTFIRLRSWEIPIGRVIL